MAEELKPQFYVLRPNNVAIPLIAMDELPHNIRVEGVPRVLTMEDVMAMKGVGKAECRHQTYRVIDVNKVPGIISTISPRTLPFQPPTPSPSASGSEANTPVSFPTSDKIFPSPKKFYGIQEQKPESDDETNILNHIVEASPTAGASSKVTEVFGKHDPLPLWKDVTKLGLRLPAPGKKVYCSHWMSTGECDYAQQGCLYKHEMPLDIEMLNHLGFQDIPKWYRERFGIGKLTAIPGSGAHIRGSTQPGLMQSNWRTSSGPVMSVKHSQGPKSAPMSRASSHPARMHPPRRAPGNNITRLKVAPSPRDFSANDLLDTAPPSPSIKPMKGLLNSKYAPMTPSPVNTRDLEPPSSDADISLSSSLAKNGSPSTMSRETVLTTNVENRATQHAPTSPRSKWKSFAANPALNDSPSEYMTFRSRPSSVISDYEAELGRENLKRDMAEAGEYAEVLAKHRSQEEQAGLAQMQEHAVAIAKEKFHEQATGDVKERMLWLVARGANRKKSARGRKGKVEGKKGDVNDRS